MAISWGGWVSASGASARLGIEVTDPNGNGQPVRATVYLEVKQYVLDSSATLTLGGTHPFTKTISVSNPAGSTNRYTLHTQDWNYPRRYGEARGGTVTATLSNFILGTANASSKWYLEPLPYSAPVALTSVTATRVSDSRATLKWSHSASTSRPVTGFAIQRERIWSGGGEGWQHITTVGASTRSFNDNSIDADMGYRYRVRAEGPGGVGPFSNTGIIYTSPAAPGSASARRDGADIVVSAVHRSRFPSNIEVWEGDTRVGTILHPYTTFRVTGADPMVPHTYRLRAALSGLYSGWVETNPVQLAVAPYAPTVQVPESGYWPDDTALLAGWIFNPADGSDQTKYEIEWRLNDGAAQYITGTGSAPFYEIPGTAGAAIGSVFSWRVRTWGQDENKPSPWSDTASLTIESRATVSLRSPWDAGGVVVETDSTEISFGTNKSLPYTFEAELYDVTTGERVGTDSGVVAGNGDATARFSGLENGKTYRVDIKVWDRVEGLPKSVEFTVEYDSPPQPILEADWDEAKGSVSLSVSNPDNDVDTYTVSNTIQRRVGDGQWVTVSEGLGLDTSIVDPIPPVYGVVEYRAVALSNVETTTASQSVFVDAGAAEAVYFNWGAGWSNVAIMRWNIVIDEKPLRIHQKEYYFDYDTEPTMIIGREMGLVLDFSSLVGKPRHDPDVLVQLDAFRRMYEEQRGVIVRPHDRPPIHGFVISMDIPRDEHDIYSIKLEFQRTKNKGA